MKGLFYLLFLGFLPLSSAAQKTWDTIPNLPDHYREKVSEFRKEPISRGKIMFLGNSITEGGNWKKLLKDSSIVNRGISGDITFGVLNRLDDIVKRQPAKVFLLIGINDISKDIPDEVIMQNTFSIVRRIRRGSPATKIFVQSILPTNPTFKNFPKGYNKNDHVITLNAQYKKYADRLGYTFVDLFTEFLDKEDHLEASYSTDGLHLSNAGYAHWLEILKKLNYL